MSVNKKEFLPKLAAFDWKVASALTEPLQVLILLEDLQLRRTC